MSKKQIFLAATLFFLGFGTTTAQILGKATAQNHVSNIRVNQRGDQLIVMYDLSEKADIEAYVSFDNGITFRGPLRQVSGDIGKEIEKGYNKTFSWDIVKEVGNIHFTSSVIKVVATPIPPVIVDQKPQKPIKEKEKPAVPPDKTSSEKNKPFFLSAGIGFGTNEQFLVDIDAALFFNRQFGLGINFSNTLYTDILFDFYDNYRDNLFVGPCFYGRFGKNNWIFSTRIGMGFVREGWYERYGGVTYDYASKDYFGFFISVGPNYVIKNIIGIGMNINLLQFNPDTFYSATLSLNFRF